MSKRPHTAMDVVVQPHHSPQGQATTNSTHSNCHGKLSAMTNRDISSLLDEQIQSLSSGWKGSIPFNMYPVVDKNEVSNNTFDGPPQQLDICQYLNGQQWPMQRLYFCPITYPPPKSNDEMLDKKGKNVSCKGWIDLKIDLETSAIDQSNPIYSNGTDTSTKDNRRFRCSTCNRSNHKSRAMDVTSENPYREQSLVHDRKNNRKDGMTKPKRNKTSRPVMKDEFVMGLNGEPCIGPNGKPIRKKQKLCPMSFNVKWDQFGFFIELERNSGNPMHEGHPYIRDKGLQAFPTRLLTKDMIDDTKHVIESTSNKAAGRNFIKSKFGKFVSSIKLAYLKRREELGMGERSTMDDIARMIDDFEKSDEIAFTSLSDVPLDQLDSRGVAQKTTATISMKKSPLGELTSDDATTLPSLKPIKDKAKQERRERMLKPEDTLFIAVAWIVIPAFRYFMLCPEGIWVDATSHSNNKGFHLLTFSCRVGDRQVVFLWVWIPNQQRFSFRWVFQHAIPNLIPKWLRDRVRFIMKDGDPQQRNEIIYAFQSIFVNAVEGGCGFHIGKSHRSLSLFTKAFNTKPYAVHFGWKKHVPGEMTITTKNRDKWMSVVRKIQQWIYSWMKPGYVENEDEYHVSKFLLIQFVCSAPVLAAAEGHLFMIVFIMKFLRCHVFVWEGLYLHYLRMHVPTFFVSHGSQHEGTNHGLKNNTSAIKPTMNMDTAARAINVQQDIKVASIEADMLSDFTKSNKLWSKYPTAPYSTSFGEGLMKQTHERAHLYASKRVGLREFETKYVGDGTCSSDDDLVDVQFSQDFGDSFTSVPIPLFTRVRTVTVQEDGTMLCTCCKFEMSFLFCEGQVSVADLCYTCQGEEFKGFTHHDCGVRYLSSYMHLAYRPSTEKHVQALFHKLAGDQIGGPQLRVSIPDVSVLPIQEREPVLSAVDRLKNYEKDEIHMELFDTMVSKTYKPVEAESDDAMYEEFENNKKGATVTETDLLELFEQEVHLMQDDVPTSSEDMFSQSINDYDVPSSMVKSTKSRDLFKQHFEESCQMADAIGVEAQQELEKCFQTFKSFCNNKTADTHTVSEGVARSGKTVAMTGAKYAGTDERIFNTHHMYRNG